jgi:hypothetical protein
MNSQVITSFDLSNRRVNEIATRTFCSSQSRPQVVVESKQTGVTAVHTQKRPQSKTNIDLRRTSESRLQDVGVPLLTERYPRLTWNLFPIRFESFHDFMQMASLGTDVSPYLPPRGILNSTSVLLQRLVQGRSVGKWWCDYRHYGSCKSTGKSCLVRKASAPG